VASPATTIKNFIIAMHIPVSKFLQHTRVVCLPGFTTTVREQLRALEKVAGKEALKLVKFKDDPVNRRIVSSWPARFDNSYALSLGFVVDEGGMVPIVRQFQNDVAAGIA
jgi:nucleoside-diphosphate-sugar epimerase